MARRLGALTATGAILLGLDRLGRLLQTEPGAQSWRVVLVAATLLGAVVTWTALSYRLPTLAIVAIDLLGMAFAVLRISAPETLRLWILPSGATWAATARELSFGWELIRYGAAPVLPVAGLTAVLAVAFWSLGAFAAAGVVRGRPLLATAPALGFYLQLATLDRRSVGSTWLLAVAALLALTLLAAAPRRTEGSGRVRRSEGGFAPRRSAPAMVALLIVPVVASLFVTGRFADAVPESGVLQWRTHSGIGASLYGGTSLNLFVGLHQDLLSLSDRPMFYARVSQSAPPNSQLYWRLITLDQFDGTNWLPSNQTYVRPTAGATRWERPDWKFEGPTTRVAARVAIAGLTEQLLPVLYSPISLQSPVGLISQTYRVREDGSIGIDVRLKEGWQYNFQADVPRPDYAALATSNGQLSPMFQAAAAAGDFSGKAEPSPAVTPGPDLSQFLDLPSVSAGVRTLASKVTEKGTTNFERALLLEAWFRDPSIFTYSTNVTTGHSALNLEAWLTDPSSRNYHTGYCEQFATAMAVMARAIGIPSRVVLGFAPGELQQQADGSQVIVVRERDAHAWVELWMTGQGWVRFDPTPRSDGVNPSTSEGSLGFDPRLFVSAPEEPQQSANGPSPGDPGFQDGPQIDTGSDPSGLIGLGGSGRGPLPTWIELLVLLGGLTILVPAVKMDRRRRRLARVRRGDVTAAWEEIVDRLRDLGTDLRGDLTPRENAVAYDPALVPLADAYSAAVYGPPRPSPGAVAAFRSAEERMASRYGRLERLGAWLRPRSLRRRR